MWTHFMDMHSGGGCKEKPYEHIYIEAPQEEAEIIFYNHFGHNPNRVTCTCCGEDYSVSEHEDLAQASAFKRACAYDDAAKKYVEQQATKWSFGKAYQSVEDYVKNKDVLIIKKEDILDSDRKGKLPQQGYVWVD